MPLLEYVLAAVVLALVLVIIFQMKIARDKIKSYAAEQVSAYKVNEEKRIKQSVVKALNAQRSTVKGKVGSRSLRIFQNSSTIQPMQGFWETR